MKKLLTLIALLIGAATNAQTLGDVLTWKKGPGLGDAKLYTTPVVSSLYALNGSGTFTLLAQSNFANASHTHTASAITDFNATGDARWSLLAHTHTFASLTSKPTTVAGYGITDFNTLGDARWALLSHTHLSAHITDASTGGNGASDAGKVVKFGAAGQLTASNDAIVGNAVVVTKTGVGGNGVSITIDNGNGINIQSDNGRGALIASIGEHDALYVQGDATTKPVIHAQSQDVTNAADLLHLHAQSNLGMEVRNNGGIAWTSATGAQTTATNLPAFGTATKGVVPASGGGTTNFMRADGSWAAPTGGSGTVTSVAVSGSDGIDIDSGSPITTSGTIALGVNASTLKTHLSLNNVENTALSTWTGSTNITRVGTLIAGSIPVSLVTGLGSLATQSGTFSGTSSGTNTGDQTSIVGITGSLAEFNTALTGADFATGGGTATGTNTGDQTNISGNAATVTTNANLTGPITSVGNATTVAETELAALATTTSAADKVPYFTGSGTASTADLKMGTEAAYTGTVSWTCGADPTTETIRQFYTQVGNVVTWTILLTYANQGTTCTNLSLTFPTEFPTPAIPTGFTGASVRIWNVDQARFLTTPTSGTVTASGTFFIIRNAADNGFVIAPAGTYASNTVRTVTLSGIYFTQ